MVLRVWGLGAACWFWVQPAHAQMQFEIPAEMLQGMFGGMMGGQPRQQKPKETEWPKGEDSSIAPEYEFLANLVFEGTKSSWTFLRHGAVSSPNTPVCKGEKTCKWAANNGIMKLITPKTMLTFEIKGADFGDKEFTKKLEDHEEKTLKKVYLETTEVAKSGKKSVLKFKGIHQGAKQEGEDSIIAKDLYQVLGVTADVDQADIKKQYRKLSITHHPDKGGDPQIFNEIREAYEMLSDKEKRRQYNIGGALLVKNMETAFKELEGQEQMAMAQLDQQVPKGHPMRAQAEAQVKAQMGNRAGQEQQIIQKMTMPEQEVGVDVTLEEIYTGISKVFNYNRMVICRGCRADPNAEQCKECSKCPPETRQIPQRQGPFVVGMKEVEVESSERCKKEPMKIEGLHIPAGAPEGHPLKRLPNGGHQTPGKFPGLVAFKVKRKEHPRFTLEGDNLYTSVTASLQEALFGFKKKWKHLDGKDLTLDMKGPLHPGQVVRIVGKGMMGKGRKHGDLFIHIHVQLPDLSKVADRGAALKTALVAAGDTSAEELNFVKEPYVEVKDSQNVWRRWQEAENAEKKQVSGNKKGKSEL